MTAAGIGKRIKAARARRSIASMAALADLAHAPNVTAAMLMNTESGRHANLTISQLLNIAWALHISPLTLLAAHGRPNERLDLPGLSPELAALTNAQFDAWILGDHPPASTNEREENTDLHLIRERRRLLTEIERLTIAAALENQALHDSANPDSLTGFQQQLDLLRNHVTRIEEHLQQDGWDISSTREEA